MGKELIPLPAPEIEVTDEMVTAGSEILAEMSANLEDGWISPDELARQVYRAMQRAKP